jgi:hypothetical protein
MVAIGAATVLVLSPLVAGAMTADRSVAVVDMRPGDGRLDDARIAAEVSRHPGADLVVLVPAGRPANATALAGLTGGDLGYWASVRTAVVIALLSAAGFFVTMLRRRRRTPDPVPMCAAAPTALPGALPTVLPCALPDDVLAAIPQRVTAVSTFGPHGGFVDAGGLIVWAALIRPGEPVHPGRSLTVLSSSHERDSLLVTAGVVQAARR